MYYRIQIGSLGSRELAHVIYGVEKHLDWHTIGVMQLAGVQAETGASAVAESAMTTSTDSPASATSGTPTDLPSPSVAIEPGSFDLCPLNTHPPHVNCIGVRIVKPGHQGDEAHAPQGVFIAGIIFAVVVGFVLGRMARSRS